ncbi:extracellular solute-binding protein [Streptomyces sp. 3MP-14]|uniref:Extracellular solute-binding protein n=1 Tax=Streptomyces mimosae TaxID=2586635 RepID=A0A5N6APV1_9ACTN|nr:MULTISPECIES: extracellular solute-binding protein [Streptomyces]KAB8170877.1 extracellular solute-binding protein [Streptomyces mimosae]KAB8179772.1 extracellular solute-binding protein [Streptomyces sp. 3MP-14]
MSPGSLSPPGFSRRQLLHGLAGLGGLAALGGTSACGSAASLGAADNRVRFWNPFTGGDGANMRAMLDVFRDEHPGIEVRDTTLAAGEPYYTKLAMAGSGGRAPELGVLHLGRIPGFAPGRLIDPIDVDLLAEFGVREEDFNPRLWQGAMVEGQLYGLPLDIHAFVHFYNRPVLEGIGLLDADRRLLPVETVDDYLGMLDAAREVYGDGPLGWNALAPGECWWAFLSLYSQTGSTIIDEDATDITLDDAAAEEVIAFLARLVADRYTIPGRDIVAFLVNGGPFAWFGSWLVVDMLNAQADVGVQRFPTFFGDIPAGQSESHTLVLPHQEGRGGETNRAAHQLMAWLVSNSLEWAKASHVPAYLPVLAEPEYLELQPQVEYRDAMDQATFDPPAWFSGPASSLQEDVGNAISAAAMGFADPASAVRDVRRAVDRLLNTPNPWGEGSTA